jgi:hypothetical protein
MRELRENVLSILLSSGGRQGGSDAHAAANPVASRYPASVTPAPPPPPPPYHHAPVAVPAWSPGAGSPMSWVTPARPVEADVRVAELTAGLVAATDVERRQARTIRRLAAQLERAERLERGRGASPRDRDGDRDRARDRPAARQSTPRRKAPRTPPLSVVDEDEEEEEEEEEEGGGAEGDDANCRDYRGSGSRMAPRRPRTRQHPQRPASAPRKQTSAAKSAKAAAEASKHASRSAATSGAKPPAAAAAAAATAADDAEFQALRRKVLALEHRGSLVEENVLLRAERTAAKEEVGHMSAVLAEIRQSASSLMADRDELLATINLLRRQNEQNARGGGGGGGGDHQGQQQHHSAEAPAPPPPAHHLDRGELQTLVKDGVQQRQSPSSIRFPDFDTPTPRRAGPSSMRAEDAGDEDACREADAPPSMEGALRAELRAVIEENAALSNRVIELERRQGASEGAGREATVEDVNASLLDDLRTEVLVLSSVAESMRFDFIGGGDAAPTQATLTAMDGGATAALLARFGDGGLEVRGAEACQGHDLRSITELVAQVRQSVALKYGEWLSSAPGRKQSTVELCDVTGLDGSAGPGGAPPRRLECDISDDSGTWDVSPQRAPPRGDSRQTP